MDRRKKERRIFDRYSTKLKAQYRSEEEEEWKECIVIDISQRGMDIIFLTHEKINEGAIIHLKIFLPEEQKLINVNRILKLVKQRENDFMGGIETTVLTREG